MDVLRKLGANARVPGFQQNREKRSLPEDLSTNGSRVEGILAELVRRANFSTAPDTSKTTAELVRAAGYPVETHDVVTADGYILEVHRIPQPGSARPPVYLQHGILCSSSVWVLQGPGRSLPYLLHDLGYDVWMGNVRGNRYGRRHLSLDPDRDQEGFWDFTFDEIGSLDLPAVVDCILMRTGQAGLLYVGHSMGTTVFFVMLSERPEYNEKVRGMVALAPAAFLREVHSPLVRLAALVHPQLASAARLLGVHEFLPQHALLRLAGRLLRQHLSMAHQTMCYNSMFAIAGFSSSQLYMDLLPLLPDHIPDRISVKTLFHFGQNVSSKRFRKYDRGCFENRGRYGVEHPPDYRLENIKVPVSVFYSEGDWLPAPNDVIALYEQLPNKNGRYKIKDAGFSHMDFLLSTSAKPLLYDTVLKILDEF